MLLNRVDELPEEIYQFYKRNGEIKELGKIERLPSGIYKVYLDDGKSYERWEFVDDRWNYQVVFC